MLSLVMGSYVKFCKKIKLTEGVVLLLGMLNDNRKIDYRNGFSFSFSCLYYRFSKWVGYVRVGCSKQGAVACLVSLLIKLKVHTSRSAVLRCVRWQGR